MISSSWIPGEISTFLLPQHSVSDLLLDFPLLKNAFSNETGAFDGDRKGIQFERGEVNKENDSKNGTSSGEIKIEESGLQPDFSNSPSGKRRKKSKEEQSGGIELNATEVAEDDLTSELLGDSTDAEDMDINLAETVASDDPGAKIEESETNMKNNVSSYGRPIFYVNKKVFTKDDEDEWHLFKLNSSNPKLGRKYFDCYRCPTNSSPYLLFGPTLFQHVPLQARGAQLSCQAGCLGRDCEAAIGEALARVGQGQDLLHARRAGAAGEGTGGSEICDT